MLVFVPPWDFSWYNCCLIALGWYCIRGAVWASESARLFPIHPWEAYGGGSEGSSSVVFVRCGMFVRLPLLGPCLPSLPACWSVSPPFCWLARAFSGRWLACFQRLFLCLMWCCEWHLSLTAGGGGRPNYGQHHHPFWPEIFRIC